MPKDSEIIIDWAEAMNQVGGDRDFLDEVLRDLLNESDEAEREMETAIKAEDYGTVRRAAHRIKGSAAYLCCNALRDVSMTLQDLGHEGESKGESKDDSKASDNDLLMDHIRKNFDLFCRSLQDLKDEIHQRKWRKKESIDACYSYFFIVYWFFPPIPTTKIEQ